MIVNREKQKLFLQLPMTIHRVILVFICFLFICVCLGVGACGDQKRTRGVLSLSFSHSLLSPLRQAPFLNHSNWRLASPRDSPVPAFLGAGVTGVPRMVCDTDARLGTPGFMTA